MRRVQIFVSSPGDVQPERAIAERVIRQLAARHANHAEIRPVLWEHRVYHANRSFQEQITAIREMDVVLGILWKRVGSELPPDRFRRPDGSSYESGTVFELETALACNGCPPVLIFKKTSPVLFTKENFAEEKRQSDLLDAWWNRTFHDEQRHFLRGYEPFATGEALEARLTLALQDWLEAEGLVPHGPIWDIDKATPFPGLKAYDADRASVFFGRSLAIGEAVERLLEHTGRAGRRPILLVIGASGSGKSSLARAGVVPRLTAPGIVPGIDDWRTLVVEPSADVLTRFTNSLFEALPTLKDSDLSAGSWRDTVLVRPQVAGETVAKALGRIEPRGRPHGLLLLLDQLETLLADPNWEPFVRVLRSLVEAAGVWLIATLRSDRYSLLQQEPVLGLKVAGVVYDLPPPGRAEIAEIVRGAERAAGLTFEQEGESQDGLAPRSLERELIAATPGPDALPLLQMSLAQLFDRREGALMRLAHLDAMGGVAGAIAAHADEIFSRLSSAARGQLQALVRALTTGVTRRADGAVVFTAAVAEERDFASTQARRELVDLFVEARLLVRDKDGALRVAHEAVLRRWQQGREALEAIADTALRRARFRALAAVAASGVFLMMMFGAVWLFLAEREAQRQAAASAQTATARLLASQAVSELDAFPQRAGLLARHAVATAQLASPEIPPDIRQAVYQIGARLGGELLPPSSSIVANRWIFSPEEAITTVFDTDSSCKLAPAFQAMGEFRTYHYDKHTRKTLPVGPEQIALLSMPAHDTDKFQITSQINVGSNRILAGAPLEARGDLLLVTQDYQIRHVAATNAGDLLDSISPAIPDREFFMHAENFPPVVGPPAQFLLSKLWYSHYSDSSFTTALTETFTSLTGQIPALANGTFS